MKKLYHLPITIMIILCLTGYVAYANPGSNSITGYRMSSGMEPGMAPSDMPMFSGPGYHWYNGPHTYDMTGPMSELMEFISTNSTFANMTQRTDGSLLISANESGQVYCYIVGQDGYNGTATGNTAPHMNITQDGSLVMSTSQGQFTGTPFFYNAEWFQNVLETGFNMPTNITYNQDGTFMTQIEGLPQQLCLRADPTAAASSNATFTPGLELPDNFSEYSHFGMRYEDGYRQNFYPAFARGNEIMTPLEQVGFTNVQMGSDGTITAQWNDGQSDHQLRLVPSMLVDSGELAPGFHQTGPGSWWFGYSDGSRQNFQAFLDNQPL